MNYYILYWGTWLLDTVPPPLLVIGPLVVIAITYALGYRRGRRHTGKDAFHRVPK